MLSINKKKMLSKLIAMTFMINSIGVFMPVNIYAAEKQEEKTRTLSQEEKDYDFFSKMNSMGLNSPESLQKIRDKITNAEKAAKDNNKEVDPEITKIKNLLDEYEKVKERLQKKPEIKNLPDKIEQQKEYLHKKLQEEKQKAETTCKEGKSCELSDMGKSYAQALAYLENQQINATTSTSKETNSTDANKKEETKKEQEKPKFKYSCPAGNVLIQDYKKCCPANQPFYRAGNDGNMACFSSQKDKDTKDKGESSKEEKDDDMQMMAMMMAMMNGNKGQEVVTRTPPFVPENPHSTNEVNGDRTPKSGVRYNTTVSNFINTPFAYSLYSTVNGQKGKLVKKDSKYLVGENSDNDIMLHMQTDSRLLERTQNVTGEIRGFWIQDSSGNLKQITAKFNINPKGDTAVIPTVYNGNKVVRVPGNYILRIKYDIGNNEQVMGDIFFRIDSQATNIDSVASIEKGLTDVSALTQQEIDKEKMDAFGKIVSASWDAASQTCNMQIEGSVQSGNKNEDVEQSGTFQVNSSNIGASQCTSELIGQNYAVMGMNFGQDKDGKEVFTDYDANVTLNEKQLNIRPEDGAYKFSSGQIRTTTLKGEGDSTVTLRVSSNGDQFLRWDGSPLTENDKLHLIDTMGLNVDNLELKARNDGQFDAYSGEEKISKDSSELSYTDMAKLAGVGSDGSYRGISGKMLEKMKNKQAVYQRSLESISQGKTISYDQASLGDSFLNKPTNNRNLLTTLPSMGQKVVSDIALGMSNVVSNIGGKGQMDENIAKETEV